MAIEAKEILHGDIYWGRIKGYPWWPCMISKDGTKDFRRIKMKHHEYFCQFFGTFYEFAWLSKNYLIEFTNADVPQLKENVRYREQLAIAIREARKYTKLSIDERIDYFYSKYLKNQEKIEDSKNNNRKRRHSEEETENIDEETQAICEETEINNKKVCFFDTAKFLKKYDIRECYVKINQFPKSKSKIELKDIVACSQSFTNLSDITVIAQIPLTSENSCTKPAQVPDSYHTAPKMSNFESEQFDLFGNNLTSLQLESEETMCNLTALNIIRPQDQVCENTEDITFNKLGMQKTDSIYNQLQDICERF